MAKKNTEGTAAAPRRASTTRRSTKKDPAAAPVDIASVTPVEPIDSAADMEGVSAESTNQPTYDDIAQEAYQRYLSRGGSDGRDFDDWIEAERELVRRRRH
ncbi:MAG TPA: DUF2934 domain-containing protein [Vicinamibacterales bacterium]